MRFASILALTALVASVVAAPAPADDPHAGMTQDTSQTVKYVRQGNKLVKYTTTKHTWTGTKTVVRKAGSPAPSADAVDTSSAPATSNLKVVASAAAPAAAAAVVAAPAAVVVSKAVTSTGNSNQDTMLTVHNNYRAKHSAAALSWNGDLASYAASHAANCVFAHTGGSYGENIAAGYTDITASIAAWYDESNGYGYSTSRNVYSDATGHFSQVVWKGSKELGCAWISCQGKNGTPGWYLMCEYHPAGNIVGTNGATGQTYFVENVLAA